MKSGTKRRERTSSTATTGISGFLAGPMGAWSIAFLFLPGCFLGLLSFWRVSGFQIVREVSLANYIQVLSTPVYRQALVGSFQIGLCVAALSSLIAFIVAWQIRFRTTTYRDRLVVLILVASMGSYLARIFSWRAVLGSGGLINYLLTTLGFTEGPLGFLIFNRFAVVTALVHLFLPFAFLPIYANLLTIEPHTLEASRVLGASPFVTFLRIGLPLGATGTIIGFAYVLIFATADFAAPAFLGGSRGVVASQIIADQFGGTFNWPLGSALSVVYVLILGVFVALLARYGIYKTKRVSQ